MKNLKLIVTALGFFALLIIGMSATMDAGDPTSVSMEMEDYYKPDFRISQVATPGGLCKGYKSKVRVTVTNSSMAGYKQDIPVRITVSQPGSKTKTYTSKVRHGFSGRDTRGKAVWFHNVTIYNYKQVTIQAEVNYDKSVPEIVSPNNRKTIKAKVGKACGAQSVAALSGKTLTVRVYNAPGASPRKDLHVEMRKGSIVRGGSTYNGAAKIENIPAGRYRMIVRQGTAVAEDRYYMMPAYNASLNIILD